MKLEAIKLEIRKIVQERSINAIAKLQQKNIEDISKALEFYKKNKHTDKKEAFIKVLKKLGNEKLKLAGELDLKVSGMYKDAEYKGEGIEEGENGLWDNIRKKKARGGKPAHKNSKAHKDAVKAGDKIKANESVVTEAGDTKATLTKRRANLVKSNERFGNLESNPNRRKKISVNNAEIKSIDSKLKSLSKNESVVNEGKFKKDDLVYNKRTKTVGIVRLGDDKSGEVKTDADGNVDVDELEKYNPIKNKHQSNAKVAPSTEKEVSKRGLFNPFKNESVVNERYSDFIKAKNLTDIIKLSKQKKNATFYVTDDNNSRIGTFYLKNGKFAKATTANANYDLQNSKTSLKNRNDVIYKYKVDESVVNEASIKGKNNKTGEAFGMVIGSDKTNRDGEFEVTVRITYSSRISSYKFMFDKGSNLIAIKDYGYSMDGKFPDMKGGGSVKSVKPNPRETITQIAKVTSPAFAKKIYQHVQKALKSIGEGVVNEMSMGFDNMTGLFYLQGVPFTKERIKEVILFMKKAQVKSKVNQFEYTPALIVKDKVGNNKVVIDSKNYEILLLAFKKNSAKLASDKDF